jgi:osmotically-inducible protein OsmY
MWQRRCKTAMSLTGTVDTYADKEDADKRVHHVKGVKGVDNEIAGCRAGGRR